MNKEQDREKKFDRISQSDMPRFSLEQAVYLAKTINDNFAGKNANPISLAQAINRKPSSSGWRMLTGSAVAYGITDGGYNAKSISLTSLGKQIVAPVEEGLDKDALIKAALRPTILKDFYEKYNKGKLPKSDIAYNVLQDMGVPKDRAQEVYKVITENANYVGIIKEISGSQYIDLDSISVSAEPKETEGSEVMSNFEKVGKEEKPVYDKTPKNSDAFSFLDNKVAVIVSKEILQKAFLNKELNQKVQNLMQSAEALAKEWKDKDNESGEKT